MKYVLIPTFNCNPSIRSSLPTRLTLISNRQSQIISISTRRQRDPPTFLRCSEPSGLISQPEHKWAKSVASGGINFPVKTLFLPEKGPWRNVLSWCVRILSMFPARQSISNKFPGKIENIYLFKRIITTPLTRGASDCWKLLRSFLSFRAQFAVSPRNKWRI